VVRTVQLKLDIGPLIALLIDHGSGILMGRYRPVTSLLSRGGAVMTKLWAVLLIVASFLLVAPVIESETSGSARIFIAVGNADGGAGGE
jgi:hypothetical protein